MMCVDYGPVRVNQNIIFCIINGYVQQFNVMPSLFDLFNYVDSFSLFIIFVILIKREEFQKFKNQFDIFFSLGMHQHKMSLQGRSQLIVASVQ